MGQWLFFVCFLVRFFRPRFTAAWLRESEPEGQEAACGFPYTTISTSTLCQHSRVRAAKPRQQLLFGRAALPGHRTLGAADAWKCSVSPSGIVCRRNPDPRLPAASRQSEKAGHQLIPQGGTHWKGHRAQVGAWGVLGSLPGQESGHSLGYPTWFSSHLFRLLKDQMFQFQPLLRQTHLGVHASCRVLFAKMMLMQRDVSRIHGSCHTPSPENPPPPQPHCHAKYPVSCNSLL